MHAAAIDALIKGIVVRLPRNTVIPFVAALVGSIVAAAIGGRRRIRWTILAGAVVLTILLSGASYRYAQYLINPLIPNFALLVSFFLFRALARTSLRHT